MLHELTLANFKAFGERAVIPLAPITLIFGENSSGKSTILQSLALMKQSFEQGSEELFLLFKPRQHIVNLGSYREAVYGHDIARPITIGTAVSDGQHTYKLEFEFCHHHPPRTPIYPGRASS